MSTKKKLPDHEIERRAAYKLAKKEFGKDYKPRFGPDTYGSHELLDRLHVIQCMLEEHAREHPAACIDSRVFEKILIASDAIMDAYQAVGQWSYEEKVAKNIE